ncbi:hypothetical protein VdG1_03425 [Verticillium dahliae VDG1]|nr:hypothetical protein VdG1_03425 [Verticillium dahliae VDG1]
MGRMVGQEKGRSQYVGSSFWTRVSDELDALKAATQGLAGGDSDDSEDDTDSPGQTASTRESERGASERNGLLFGHNLGPSAPDLGQFRPLPSQIPFLVDVFSENVNFCIQIVHMPVLRDMIREMRGKSSGGIPPANEALAFAVYYAAVTSMSEEDVASSFGATKAELNYKFRLGLEHALAHADFIRLPTVTLIQAFSASPARYDSEYGVTPFSEWFPSDEYTQPHEIAGASHDQLDEMGLPVDWSRSGSLGLDLTPGSWDMADFDQLGGADMDMNGEESMNWGQWLESATLMEMDNL